MRYLPLLLLLTLSLQTQAAPPNILLLLTDDHRHDALGCANNPVIKTPHIDSLAATGVRFSNAFVTTSICAVSRASIFTGQYARRHDIHGFATPLSPDQRALSYPHRLKKAGYQTAFIGKYGVGDRSPPPLDDFDYYKGFPGQGHYFPNRAATKPATRAATRNSPLATDNSPLHLTDLMTTQALEFLTTCDASRPFCLSISYKAPHAQDTDPKQYLYHPRYADLYKDAAIPVPHAATDAAFKLQPDFIQTSESRRRWGPRFATPELFQEMIKSYYRLITHVDDSVGQIRAHLAKLGLADNTVIVFLGDNGYYFGEHGLADKWFPHEPSIRVPLILHDPRAPKPQQGQTRTEMALNIDVAPTLLALANLPVPPEMQGRPLTPFLTPTPPTDWRTEFFYEHLFNNKAIPKSEGVRTPTHTYWRYLEKDHDTEHLFDLAKDPHQLDNLAKHPAHQQLLTTLRQKTSDYCNSLK